MSQPLDLTKLLAEVGRARSPLKRLRLLVQGWHALKGLGRDERVEVARNAGLLGFEELLERLGHGGPEEAEALREVLEAAEEIDPSRAAETLRALRDPIRRKDLIRRGAAVLSEARARGKHAPGRGPAATAARPGAEGVVAASSSGEAVARSPGTPSSRGPVHAPLHEEPPSPSTSPIPMEAPAGGGAAEGPRPLDDGGSGAWPASIAPLSVAGLPPQSPPGDAPITPGIPPPRAVVEPGAPGSASAAQPALVPPSPPPVVANGAPSWSVPPAAVAAPDARRGGPAHAAIGSRPRWGERSSASIRHGPAVAAGGHSGPASLAQRIGRARSLAGRFRILREALASGERPEGERLDALLARFAPGWQRRRALATILRAGLPASLDEALEKIEALDRPTDRAWCLRALVEGRTLDEPERWRLAGLIAPATGGAGESRSGVTSRSARAILSGGTRDP